MSDRHHPPARHPEHSPPPPRWVAWCVTGALLAALPSAVWRLALAAGHPLGTPAEWREMQDIPGGGTWYVLALSVIQLLAAVASFALAVDLRRFVPRRAPAWVRGALPGLVGLCGVLGTAALALIVVMSALAWDKVDPFMGEPYDAWGRLAVGCYASAALWPLLLGAATAGYLANRRPVRRRVA